MANPNSNYRLSCTVSGNDTFNSWKNPKGVVVHNSSGFEYETSGDEHKLKILRLEVEDGGVWTCLSNEGNNDTITLHILCKFTFMRFDNSDNFHSDVVLKAVLQQK